MNYSRALTKTLLVLLTTIFCVCSSQANTETDDATRAEIRTMLAHGDWQSITNLMNSDYQTYKASPSVEAFSRLAAIAEELYSYQQDQPPAAYWMFRKAVWKVILAPLPPITDPESDPDQMRTMLYKKHNLLLSVMMTSRPSFQHPRSYEAYRRHDAAMLLLSYETWLKSYIVPNYQWKPVAPINADLAERVATRQNGIDNGIQSELRTALGDLESEYAGQIRALYSEKPKNEAEAKVLVDAINMPEILKQAVLKYAGDKP